MMGHRQVEQAALFYEFSLDRHVPADHLLRSIDRFVELGDLGRELAPFYSIAWATIDRSGVDGPNADYRLLLWDPIRASTVRGSAPQFGLSVVLPFGTGCAVPDHLQPSRKTDMVASAIAICCGTYSRRYCVGVWRKAWLVATVLPSMPA